MWGRWQTQQCCQQSHILLVSSMANTAKQSKQVIGIVFYCCWKMIIERNNKVCCFKTFWCDKMCWGIYTWVKNVTRIVRTQQMRWSPMNTLSLMTRVSFLPAQCSLDWIVSININRYPSKCTFHTFSSPMHCPGSFATFSISVAFLYAA